METAELMKQLALGGITVQGDFVMEKKVEYEVNNVEAGGIGIQVVNGAREEEGKEKEEEKKNIKKKPGPSKEVLFIEGTPSWEKDGKPRNRFIENKVVCRQEKERLMQYIAAHKLNNRKLNCTSSDVLNKVIVCFAITWSDLGFTSTPPSSRAIFRFLTQECNIKSETTEASYANKISEWMKKEKYDVEIMRKVKLCF